MGLATSVRRLVVESPNSLGGRARSRRWTMVRELFPDIEDMTVVDLGGCVDAWEQAPVKPRHVTILNLYEPGESDDPTVQPLMGDACDAEAVLMSHLGHASFDLVFSNAVLEHVGGHANRLRFAESVRRLGPRHWIQTPYRYFPLEPHWLFPGMQFLPVAARARISLHWPLAHSPSVDEADALSAVQWTELLGVTEMRAYFPESQILHEKTAGLTKSLVAVKQ